MSISSLGISLRVPPLSPSKLDAATQAFILNAQTVDGTFSDLAISATDALVKGLKQDGLWHLIHEIYPFIGSDAGGAPFTKMKYVTASPYLSPVGFTLAADYNQATGLKGNGSSKYIKTGYVPSIHQTPHNLSVGYWNQDNSAGQFALAAFSSSSQVHQLLAPRATDNNRLFSDIYEAAAGRLETALSSPYQFISVSKLGNSHKAYQNAVLRGSNSSLVGSPPEIEYYLFARNLNGIPDGISAYGISFIYIADGLADGQMLKLYNRVLAFQQSLGRV
jgi:hypothetical protein